jgi:FemAB-related protein (PEP-CTERM system-associated)
MVTIAEGAACALPAEDAPRLTVSRSASSAEWNAFVAEHPLGTIEHLWEWRRIFRDAFGFETEYLVARRDSAVVGVLPLVLLKSRVFGRQVVSLPMVDYGGLLLRDGAAAEPLLDSATDLARRFGAAHLELRQQQRTTMLPSRHHKLTMRRALPADVGQLWNAIDRKVRNQVRKAQKSNLSVAVGGSELLGEFYRVFSENMRDLGTPVYPRRWFERMLEEFPSLPARVRLHVVRLDGRPIAGGCVLQFRDVDFVPSASALRRARHLSPNMLLYWSLLESAVERGAQVFDFGRSSPESGTYQFKMQWGAQAQPQSWEYVLLRGQRVPDQSPSNRHFRAAVEVWKRLPLWLANRIGPAVVRNLP